MSMPVGKEWNTGDTYRRMIQPDLLTKAGTIGSQDSSDESDDEQITLTRLHKEAFSSEGSD